MSYKLHCDLCGRDISHDENTTKITWEDYNGYTSDFGHVFRTKQKFKADICDDCLKLLREKVSKEK